MKIGYKKHQMLFDGESLNGHEFIMLKESVLEMVKFRSIYRKFECKKCLFKYESSKHGSYNKCHSHVLPSLSTIENLKSCEEIIMQRVLS